MGKKKSKTKSVTTPWTPAQPAILGAINTATGIVNDNQGNLNDLAGSIRGQLPQLQSMAFGPNASLDAANGYAQNVLGGQYLNAGNPYMQGMINQTANDVGNRYNSTFSSAGRTGSGAHRTELSQGLANAENSLRYQDYNAERDRMAQQGAMVPGLTQAQYAGIAPWLMAAQQAGQLPYAGVGALSPIIGLANGSGTTKGTQPGGWGTDLLNAAASAAGSAAMASDRRLKKNLKRVGEFEDGLGIWTWVYRNDPSETVYRGVVADEVKELRPHAYVENFDGFGHSGVNYGAL